MSGSIRPAAKGLDRPRHQQEAAERARSLSPAEQWLLDLDAVEGDACFFCAMGELLRARMEGRVA